MSTAILILISIAIVLASNALAFYVSHQDGLPEVKPFNCYGCLAFWFTLLAGLALAWWQYSALLAYTAVVSAFLNYFYVKSKYQIYE